MIEEKIESFFVSESLQDKLTPEMLEATRQEAKDRFCLALGDENFEILKYTEDTQGVMIVLNTPTDKLGSVLKIEPSALKIKAGEIEISKDLGEYELTLSIIRMDEVLYEATLSFEKPSRGIING